MEMKVFLFSNQACILASFLSPFPVYGGDIRNSADIYSHEKNCGSGKRGNIEKCAEIVSLLLPPPRFDYTSLIAQAFILRAIGPSFLLYSCKLAIVFPQRNSGCVPGAGVAPKPPRSIIAWRPPCSSSSFL